MYQAHAVILSHKGIPDKNSPVLGELLQRIGATQEKLKETAAE